jgi:penicillin-binding protein 1A
VTLLELTSAYAALSARQWPVKPHPIAIEEPGFFASLFDGRTRFGSRTHREMEEMLAAVVSQGTGRAAGLRIKAYGKTGTSQDNRDALFVGYAGDLVVGVWIGNDDNSPLSGITGGGLPARIWRDFMGQSIKGARPAATPRPKRKDEPVTPLDLPDLAETPIRIDENTEVRLDTEKGVTLNTEIGGVPLDLRVGRDGFEVDTGSKRRGRNESTKKD